MKGLAPISLDHGLCKITGNLLDYFWGWSILGPNFWEISKLQSVQEVDLSQFPPLRRSLNATFRHPKTLWPKPES